MRRTPKVVSALVVFAKVRKRLNLNLGFPREVVGEFVNALSSGDIFVFCDDGPRTAGEEFPRRVCTRPDA